VNARPVIPKEAVMANNFGSALCFNATTTGLTRRLLLAVAVILSALYAVAEARAASSNGLDETDISPRDFNALCLRLRAATVRVISGTDRSSGVIVSKDGHILTVAHGLHQADGVASIILADGKNVAADILLRDTTTDVAVLKIHRTAITEFASIFACSESNCELTHLVLAAGYPGREKNGLSPVLRIGKILAVERDVLRSSCTLTAGDSGGPLINHRGELIGLHRQIGLGNDSNLHLRTEAVSVALRSIPNLQTHLDRVSPQPPAIPKHVPMASPDVLKSCQQRTLEIQSGPDSTPSIILGTLLDSSHVATKLSELVPGSTLSCRFADGRQSAATIHRVSIPMDTAILRLTNTQPGIEPLPIPSQSLSTRSEEPTFNGVRIVFASTGHTTTGPAGIVCRWQHQEAGRPGKLGAVLELGQGGGTLTVAGVAPNSTASAGELVSGDTLLMINDLNTTTLNDVSAILTKSQPGDWLSLKFSRGMDVRETFARFQHDPGEQFERTEFLDGRSGQISLRRTGFENVIQHDVPLTPEQCGGPLCDHSGQIIAVNIARRAREASLAIPVELLLQLAASEPSAQRFMPAE
jgi:S1-C subfamily serine protease